MPNSPITVNQRYKSSTRIDSDIKDYKNFVDDFILHGTAINTLDTISKAYDGSEQRAYTLTGPYGVGKSTIALYLSLLLSPKKAERDYAQDKLSKADKSLTKFPQLFNVKKGWKVIRHVCGLEAPANAILISFYNAFKIDYSISKVKKYSDEQCLEEIKATLASAPKKQDGVLFLLDEMGKALDYQSRNNKDLYLFQALADISQQAKLPVVLMGFLHQSFSDYAKNKDATAQKDWAKVQGRYTDLSFNPSIDESLILVGDSISKDKKITTELQKEYQLLVEEVSISFKGQNRNKQALLKTLPLDPLVSLLLGPISRRRFSQNERSLFGFLSSHEKFGFKEFLANQYLSTDSELALYQPEQLWDYLHHNLHHLIITSHDSKAWLEGCDAIHRAESKGSELHVSITKIVALLTIFGFHHKLHAKRAFIAKYLQKKGIPKTEIVRALLDLEEWTIIIYRQNHNALFVFQGSDIDINNMVLERIEAVSEGIDWTKACESSQNILATAHYHRTGTMRWANTKLINKFDEEYLSSITNTPLTGQAFLNFILPASPSAAKALRKATNDIPYVVIGDYSNLQRLKSAAIELISLEQITRSESALNHDLIAKNELKNRTLFAKQNVDDELQIAFKQASWQHQGKKLGIKPLSVHASNIADEIFHLAPCVQNELVNRSKPSGSANTAIRKLLHAMHNNGNQEDLGFTSSGFPPEKAIYLSCLKSKGWHCDTAEGFLFPSQWSTKAKKDNAEMHKLWKDGADYIKNSNVMITLDDLYNRWMRPPFGLTLGLCKIYGLALIKSLDGQIAYYDQDSTKQFIFIPELDEELIDKVYKHPKEAGIRYFHISDIQSHLLDTLAESTLDNGNRGDKVLGIAKHIVRIVHTLPTWVKKTSGENFTNTSKNKGLSKEARTFRNKVIKAHDPYALILEELPQIFGININDKDSGKKLAHSLKSSIEELSGQHEMLLSGFKSILLDGLSAKLDDDLLKRCLVIVKAAQRPNIKELANRLIKVIEGKDKFEIILNLAIGAPERNWTDLNIRNGLDELQNICTQFRRIESFSTSQKNSKNDSKPLAMMTTDDSGSYISYESFIKHGLENDKEVKSTIKLVNASLKSLSKEKKIASLTALLSVLMEMEEITDE
jgi:energy-coupling factor transporter ATP-binding protein EcfA2